MSIKLHIGTAGWSIASSLKEAFPAGGTHLERYGRVFTAVEINSSFYRSHRKSTYQRWAAAVPPGFRFSVKVPRTVTHVEKLRAAEPLLDSFLDEIAGLGDKLGPLVVQLPPSLALNFATAERFFTGLRERMGGPIVCEPRHASWFMPEVAGLFEDMHIARVAADPALVPDAKVPGGWSGVRYWRLHGSPRMYYSAYSDEDIQTVMALASASAAAGSECYCIFDNTASGAAIPNALTARRMAREPGLMSKR